MFSAACRRQAIPHISPTVAPTLPRRGHGGVAKLLYWNGRYHSWSGDDSGGAQPPAGGGMEVRIKSK